MQLSPETTVALRMFIIFLRSIFVHGCGKEKKKKSTKSSWIKAEQKAPLSCKITFQAKQQKGNH